jgi:hypothetical protein
MYKAKYEESEPKRKISKLHDSSGVVFLNSWLLINASCQIFCHISEYKLTPIKNERLRTTIQVPLYNTFCFCLRIEFFLLILGRAGFRVADSRPLAH